MIDEIIKKYFQENNQDREILTDYKTIKAALTEYLAKTNSSDDGLACTCGNKTFTHRHTNWIECTACNKIKRL